MAGRERGVRGTEEISRVEEIRFRVDARKRGNGMGDEGDTTWGGGEQGGREGSGVADRKSVV